MNQNTKNFIKEFSNIFWSRKDVYAIGVDAGKKPSYMPARTDEGLDKPLTKDVFLEHFKGEKLVGVYPLFNENKTKWIAIDFDGSSWQEAFADAKTQRDVLRDNGIISYIERSKSGKGAHVWIFFNQAVDARIPRSVIGNIIVESDVYDRMFPNQDSAKGKYGNLIVLPYHGKSFKDGNTAFVTDLGEPINPKDFIKDIKTNDVSYIKSLYNSENTNDIEYEVSSFKERDIESLSGAIKVTRFCSWMQEAKKRMSQQNQEPEFYALCLQFAQLEEGERLAYEYGRLHPYDDQRIKKKFEHAKEANMPHTCKTLREEHGFECTCDIDYGVNHPYELAKLPFGDLVGSRKGKPEPWIELSERVINKTKQVYKTGDSPGWAFGNDGIDNLTSIRKGELLVLGARTRVGKSSYGIHLSANLNAKNIPTYWASLEMSKQELGYKYLSRVANVDSKCIRNGTLDFSQWKRILTAQKETKDVPLYIDDQTTEMDFLLDNMGSLVSQHGPGLIVVDYIELFRKKPGESPKAMTERVIIELKWMAKFLDVPVLVFSNFNRMAEHDIVEGNDPLDSWIRNSGLVEQSSDVVLYLLGHQSKGIQKRKLRIQKDRHTGAGGEEVEVWFDGSTSTFMDTHPTLDNGKAKLPDSISDMLFNSKSSLDDL